MLKKEAIIILLSVNNIIRVRYDNPNPNRHTNLRAKLAIGMC